MPRSENVLTELEQERPELAKWLHPLRVSLSALVSDRWRYITPRCATNREPDAPLLHHATIPLDHSAARAHVVAVLNAALGSAHRARLDRIDHVALLEWAIAQDADAISAHAADAELDAPALHAAAQLAAVPLLIACARSVAAEPLTQWTNNYCHVCGARPILAEVLGLDRARQLRCGRCGAAWKSAVLLCAFCNESNHAQLGSLVPEGAAGQIAWVETCNTCRGYIKARATLRATMPEMVLVEDARTLDLDLVAHERGFAKPETSGYHVRVRLSGADAGAN